MPIDEKPWLIDEQRALRELQLFFLCRLYKDRSDLVFKGGTSLDLFYGSNRFSEDLDFDCEDLEGLSSIDEAIEALETDAEHTVLNDWTRERSVGRGFTRYLLRVSSLGTKSLVNFMIDYSVDTPKYAPALIPLKCDKSLVSVAVMQEREILAEKVRAIMEREKARDLYDLYHLVEVRKVHADIRDIYEKCKRGASGKPVAYSFTAFRKRVLALRSRWKDLDTLLENPKTYRFENVSECILDAFRSL